jgi:hypothetical protein
MWQPSVHSDVAFSFDPSLPALLFLSDPTCLEERQCLAFSQDKNEASTSPKVSDDVNSLAPRRGLLRVSAGVYTSCSRGT